MKTTRNIQEGLPFTTEHVKRQTSDTRLLAAVCYIQHYVVTYSDTELMTSSAWLLALRSKDIHLGRCFLIELAFSGQL